MRSAIETYQRMIGQPAAQLIGGGVRGFLGLDVPSYATDLGREAYRTGQAMGNMPGIGAPAGAFKAAAMGAQALPAVAGEIGRIVSAMPTPRQAAALQAEDFLAYQRGIPVTDVSRVSPTDLALTQSRIANKAFDAGRNFVKQVEELAEKHGEVYVRWSPSQKTDMQGKQQSRDFVSGETHAGLSAVKITKDMHPIDIASKLNEYSFLRAADEKSAPHLYLAKEVGKDSDGYSSIKPTKYLVTADDKAIRDFDSKLARVMELEYNIDQYNDRIARGAYHWKSDLEKATAELNKLLSSE
jgi:hypothetical protein